jgi:hypothetical protein
LPSSRWSGAPRRRSRDRSSEEPGSPPPDAAADLFRAREEVRGASDVYARHWTPPDLASGRNRHR